MHFSAANIVFTFLLWYIDFGLPCGRNTIMRDGELVGTTIVHNGSRWACVDRIQTTEETYTIMSFQMQALAANNTVIINSELDGTSSHLMEFHSLDSKEYTKVFSGTLYIITIGKLQTNGEYRVRLRTVTGGNVIVKLSNAELTNGISPSVEKANTLEVKTENGPYWLYTNETKYTYRVDRPFKKVGVIGIKLSEESIYKYESIVTVKVVGNATQINKINTYGVCQCVKDGKTVLCGGTCDTCDANNTDNDVSTSTCSTFIACSSTLLTSSLLTSCQSQTNDNEVSTSELNVNISVDGDILAAVALAGERKNQYVVTASGDIQKLPTSSIGVVNSPQTTAGFEGGASLSKSNITVYALSFQKWIESTSLYIPQVYISQKESTIILSMKSSNSLVYTDSVDSIGLLHTTSGFIMIFRGEYKFTHVSQCKLSMDIKSNNLLCIWEGIGTIEKIELPTNGAVFFKFWLTSNNNLSYSPITSGLEIPILEGTILLFKYSTNSEPEEFIVQHRRGTRARNIQISGKPLCGKRMTSNYGQIILPSNCYGPSGCICVYYFIGNSNPLVKLLFMEADLFQTNNFILYGDRKPLVFIDFRIIPETITVLSPMKVVWDSNLHRERDLTVRYKYVICGSSIETGKLIRVEQTTSNCTYYFWRDDPVAVHLKIDKLQLSENEEVKIIDKLSEKSIIQSAASDIHELNVISPFVVTTSSVKPIKFEMAVTEETGIQPLKPKDIPCGRTIDPRIRESIHNSEIPDTGLCVFMVMSPINTTTAIRYSYNPSQFSKANINQISDDDIQHTHDFSYTLNSAAEVSAPAFIKIEGRPQNMNIYVYVVEPLRFTCQTALQRVIKKGRMLALALPYEGLAYASKIYKDGNPYELPNSATARLQISSPNLEMIFVKVDDEHMGQYVMTLYGPEGNFVEAKLKIIPEIDAQTPGDIQINTCRLTMCEITWRNLQSDYQDMEYTVEVTHDSKNESVSLPVTKQNEHFKINDLRASDKYNIQVSAIMNNRKSPPKPYQATVYTAGRLKLTKVVQHIHVLRKYTQKEVSIEYTGSDILGIKLLKDSIEVNENLHGLSVEIDEHNVKLIFKNATTINEGMYDIISFNEFGRHDTVIILRVVGSPAAPEGPIKHDCFDGHSCVLTWTKPKTEHGFPIESYLLEWKYEYNDVWQKEEVDSLTTEYAILNLKPENTYKFRVRAKNCGGLGESLETSVDVNYEYPLVLPENQCIP